MSDLNNKHIPSDLDSMTAKDLRELVLIQIEHGQQAEKENAKLRARVNGLTHNITEMSKLIKTEQDRAEKAEAERDELERKLGLTVLTTHEASLNSEVGKRFAIEQKINGYVKGFIRGYKQCEDDMDSGNWTDDEDNLIDYARDFSEQLRKELEK